MRLIAALLVFIALGLNILTTIEILRLTKEINQRKRRLKEFKLLQRK